MRTMLLALVAIATAASSFGQYSARTLTRRIAPQTRPAPAPVNPNQQQQQQQQNPNQTQQNQTQNSQQQNSQQTTTRQTPAPVPYTYQYAATTTVHSDPAKAAAEKAKNDEKQFEYFKRRADEGSDHAQYELGVRYLAGRGTTPDEKLGREWLAKAAKNGNSQAAKKLAELGAENEKPADTLTAPATTDANAKTADSKPAENK